MLGPHLNGVKFGNFEEQYQVMIDVVAMHFLSLQDQEKRSITPFQFALYSLDS